jgi:hypothetical protein
MSLAAPVVAMRNPDRARPLLGIGCCSRRRHSPNIGLFPQAPKLSTTPLGRNRSGDGKGGIPGRLGPSSWNGATWGLPPSKRGFYLNRYGAPGDNKVWHSLVMPVQAVSTTKRGAREGESLRPPGAAFLKSGFSAAAAATSRSPAASLGAQNDRRHGIASAHAIWPSKPSVFAMSR